MTISLFTNHKETLSPNVAALAKAIATLKGHEKKQLAQLAFPGMERHFEVNSLEDELKLEALSRLFARPLHEIEQLA